MKKISIIGLGDVLAGDHGAACHVLDDVAKRMADEAIQMAFMGQDPRLASGLLFMADLAIIVGAMHLTGVPGAVHVWNNRVFETHAQWMARTDPLFRRLLVALAKTDLADGFPEKMLFIWIEPQLTEGYAISKPVRRAIRRVVRRINQELLDLGLTPAICCRPCSERVAATPAGPY